ncbi:MAG: zinc-ribbon domain-containing protein, partial [Candidatus Heimdallarchaeota archaeon]
FSSYEGADIIFSVMNDNYFELWVNAGNPEPEILNSTLYYEVHVTIVPWGHIIAAGIMAVLLLFGATGIGIRVIHVTVYNAKQERRARGSNVEGLQVSEQPATNKKDGVFCQSCGSPLTPKDTRYCPQCGASV